MKKYLLLVVTVMIAQLLVVNSGFANDSDIKNVSGFVFQDNNVNGEFDESDNIFPSALVGIQAVGSDTVDMISVDSTGYFETASLLAGDYYIWAEHYDLISDKQLVTISNASTAGMLVIGLSAPESITRTFDDPSVYQDIPQAGIDSSIPEADTDATVPPPAEVDMNVNQADTDMNAPTFSHSILLPLVTS